MKPFKFPNILFTMVLFLFLVLFAVNVEASEISGYLSWRYIKWDIADLSLIAVIATVVIVLLIIGVFKFLAKRK